MSSTFKVVTTSDGQSSSQIQAQQIYIIETTDGTIPVESAEVVVADDMAVYETVSALEQLSRGNSEIAGNGNLLQVYEEVVLDENSHPSSSSGSNTTTTVNASSTTEFVDVAEVEVGNGRSASPVKIGIVKQESKTLDAGSSDGSTVIATPTTAGEFHICRICNQFVLISDIAEHNAEHHGTMRDLTCVDCAKIFKSKRSLFGHRKEKHSGITESHSCPECGKTFGRKSNLKAHRESLHYGKKFPCAYCDRIFTNRSSMNQHIKKTHTERTATTVII